MPAEAQEKEGQGAEPLTTVYSFDMGTKDSPLWPGFIRISENTAYTRTLGYGWSRTQELTGSDTKEWAIRSDPLGRDWVRSMKGPMAFNIDLENGEYKVHLWVGGSRGWWQFPILGPYTIRAEGKKKVETTFDKSYYYRYLNEDYRKGQDVWKKYVDSKFKVYTFTTVVKDGQLNLIFAPGTNFPLNAMIVYPSNLSTQVEKKIDIINQKRKQDFMKIWPGYDWERVKNNSPLPAITAEDRKKGYLLFIRNYGELLYPNTIPRKDEIKDKIKVFATPGEYEPVSFAVYPLTSLKDISVTVSDLIAKDGSKINKEQIDVRLVKYRERAPVKTYTISYHWLVKRDKVMIEEGVDKQFWLTIKVPENARAGLYYGKILFHPKNKPSSQINLELKVLPFKLLSPPDVNWTLFFYFPAYYYRWAQEGKEGNDYWQMVKKECLDIKEHGFKIELSGFAPQVDIEEGKIVNIDFTNLERYMKFFLRQDILPSQVSYYGIHFTVTQDCNFPLTRASIKRIREFRDSQDFFNLQYITRVIQKKWQHEGWPEFIFYPDGELEGKIGGQGVKWGETVLKALKETGVKTISGINGKRTFKYLLPLQDFGFFASPPSEIIIKKVKNLGLPLWYYENALNRFTAGFYAWKTGAKRISREGYIIVNGEPYNDLDGTQPDWGISLPSPEGPVPTIDWEWMREGVDDYRYIYTLTTLIERAKTAGRKEAVTQAAAAEKMLEQLKDAIPLLKTPLWKGKVRMVDESWEEWRGRQKGKEPPNQNFDKERWKIAQQIIKLKEFIKK